MVNVMWCLKDNLSYFKLELMNWIIHKMKSTVKKRGKQEGESSNESIKQSLSMVEKWWAKRELGKLKDSQWRQWLKARSDSKRHFMFDLNVNAIWWEQDTMPLKSVKSLLSFPLHFVLNFFAESKNSSWTAWRHSKCFHFFRQR